MSRAAQPSSSASAIADFWSWWAELGEARATEAFASAEPGDLHAELSARVAAMSPGLEWEFGEGVEAEHALVVTSAGIAELRPVVERWFQRRPPASPLWEFARTRRRDPSAAPASVVMDDIELDLALTTIEAFFDEQRCRFDVKIVHPEFARLHKMRAAQVSFLVLDWLLGEDDVERWIGAVEWSADATPAAEDPSALLEAVTAQALAMADTEQLWVVGGAKRLFRKPVMVNVIRPLRSIDYPVFDLHSEIQVAYETGGRNGLPSVQSLDFLNHIEQHLVAELGSLAVLVAMVSTKGVRAYHVYSDSEDPRARRIIEDFRPELEAPVRHGLDPGWRHMASFA